MAENFEGHQPSEQVDTAAGHLIPLDRVPTVIEMPTSELGEVRVELGEPSLVTSAGTGAPIVEPEFGDFHVAAGRPGMTQQSPGDGKPHEGAGDTVQLVTGSATPHGQGESQVQATGAGVEQQQAGAKAEGPSKKKESSKLRKASEEKGKKSKMKTFRNPQKEKVRGKGKDDVVDDKLAPVMNDADAKSRKSICKLSVQCDVFD